MTAAGPDRAARRAFDLAVSSAALLLLGLPFLLVGALIKLGSPGPVFFVQSRVGRGGRPFGLRKFRTMRAAPGGPAVTARADPRITPVGRILRRWKIDELPQLWNVFRGDMSIIGPRPEVEKFVRLYDPAQREVLEEKPGLAGMAQLVYPHEAELLEGHHDPERAYIEVWMPRKLAVDIAYARRRTFLSDMILIAEMLLLIVGVRRHVDDAVIEAMDRRRNDREARSPASGANRSR